MTNPQHEGREALVERLRKMREGAIAEGESMVTLNSVTVDRILAALSLPHEVERDGWELIETAPFGTGVLVCVTHNLPDGEWETIQWVDSLEDSCWLHYRNRIDIPFPPTHWRQLPAAPQTKGEGGQTPAAYRWTGEGPEPARWTAADGTIVYRSYGDYCDD